MQEQGQKEESSLSDVDRFTVHWRRDDKQAADEDALLSGAHTPVSSSPRSPWKSLINAQALCVPPAPGADEF